MEGTIYGFNYIWLTNALTGKVDMTPDEVLESVRLVIDDAKRQARLETVARVREEWEKDERGIYAVLDAIEAENGGRE